MKKKKQVSYYKGKTPIEGQSCKRCEFARFTNEGIENYCSQTKRFGKASRGQFCRHFKKIKRALPKEQEVKKIKQKKWSKLIKQAKKELAEQKFYYKDKPVNGEPTERQINAIKRFCSERNLNVSIIGINRAEASAILKYFFNKTGIEEKPKYFSKYISEKK